MFIITEYSLLCFALHPKKARWAALDILLFDTSQNPSFCSWVSRPCSTKTSFRSPQENPSFHLFNSLRHSLDLPLTFPLRYNKPCSREECIPLLSLLLSRVYHASNWCDASRARICEGREENHRDNRASEIHRFGADLYGLYVNQNTRASCVSCEALLGVLSGVRAKGCKGERKFGNRGGHYSNKIIENWLFVDIVCYFIWLVLVY